jgi:hypothetical protein
MADKQSRLAEIYKAEKSKGGGIASTLSKRAIEKLDPRQFFNQKGFMATALPSLFKSYSATPTKSGGKIASLGGGSFSSGVLETKLDILTGETRELKIHSKLAAKNSSVLPAMAMDMNLTKLNIMKLVKLQGGTATTKADMFFKRAGDRETAYESRFNKAGGVTTKTPTQVGAKPKEEKESDGILGFLGTIAKYLLKGGLLGLLAIGVGKLLENQDVAAGIKSFIKQVILGIQNIIQKGSEVLGDLFSDPDVKEGFIKTFVAIKDLFVKGINLLGDLASDPRFAEGVVQVFSAIYEAIKKAFVSLDTYLKDQLNVPGGLLTILAAGGALYLAITALGGALAGLAAAAGAAAGRLGLPLPAPGAPAPGAPAPGKPAPGAPAPGKSGGFNKTAEDKIRERATRMATEQGAKDVAKKGAGEILKRFFAGEAAALLGGPIGAAWLTAYTAYQVIDTLAPDSQLQVIDGVAALASIQDDINQGGNEKVLKQRAVFYEEKLKRLGIVPQQLESAKVQALPSAPNESGAETARLAATGKPTPITSTSSAPATTPTAPTAAPSSASNSSGQSSNNSLLDIIAGGESGSMGYDAANKGKAGDMPGGYPGLSKMTVNEVMRLQSEGKVFATGRYQIIPTTLAGLMSGAYGNTGVKGGDLYDASTQDKLGTALINKRLKQGGSDPIQQQFALSQEFASIANPYTGSSYYDKVGNNKASIGTQTIQAALSGSGAPPSTVVASVNPSTPASAPDFKMPTVGTLAAAAPNIGDMIASATSAFGDITRAFDTAMASVTNITNNNTQASPAAQQSQGNLPSVYDDVFLSLFQRVS